MALTATEVRLQPWTGLTGPGSASPGHVFVSHSRWDRADASRLVAWLGSAGVRTWISGLERHCPVWPDSIFPNIASCSALVVLMSPRSEVAGGVNQEVRYAEALGKPVIPVALDGWCYLRRADWPVENMPGNALPSADFLRRVRAHAWQ